MTHPADDLERVAVGISQSFGGRLLTKEEILILLAAEISRTYTHAERGYAGEAAATCDPAP